MRKRTGFLTVAARALAGFFFLVPGLPPGEGGAANERFIHGVRMIWDLAGVIHVGKI